jgi:hypothetical protein
MPRLSRHETNLVIPLLRQAAGQGSGSAKRLLCRLEQALAESIGAIRRQRACARAASSSLPAGGERQGAGTS